MFRAASRHEGGQLGVVDMLEGLQGTAERNGLALARSLHFRFAFDAIGQLVNSFAGLLRRSLSLTAERLPDHR